MSKSKDSNAIVSQTAVESDDFTPGSLEAAITMAKCEPRPMSREQNHVYRHADAETLGANDLEYDFDVDPNQHPFDNVQSLQDAFAAVQFHELLRKASNFEESTKVECLRIAGNNATWLVLDDSSLPVCLEDISGVPAHTRKHLIFFTYLHPAAGTTYGARSCLSREGVRHLFSSLRINHLFLPNLLGRPDYWAPETYTHYAADGTFLGADYFCQHPRWNLHLQGSPLSVYMKHDAAEDLTVYIVNGKPGDFCVQALRRLLDITVANATSLGRSTISPLNDPFELHVMLSNLSCETSKYHVKKFRRYMWTQLNQVDDHLAGLDTSDRSKLKLLTKELQVISQNADSMIANANVAIYAAEKMQLAHKRMHRLSSQQCAQKQASAKPKPTQPSPWKFETSIQHTWPNPITTSSSQTQQKERLCEVMHYIISSMEKQKMWLLNYKQRKDITTNLVFHLVTQQDATNNMEIAYDMRRDSSSMNVIAAMTMLFLPGTFTSTVLGAGIFSAYAGGHSIHVSGIWWLWVATTVPLTVLVIGFWMVYQKRREWKLIMKRSRWVQRCRNLWRGGRRDFKGEKVV